METMYDITERYKSVLEMIEMDETDEVLKDTLDAIDGEFEEKSDNIVALIKSLELKKGGISGQREVFEKEVKTLKDKETSIDNTIANLKKYLCDSMIAVGKPKFKTQRFSYWIQKNTPAVVIDKPESIPEDFYRKPEPEVNKQAIKEALLKGEALDFAHLEATEGVRFR